MGTRADAYSSFEDLKKAEPLAFRITHLRRNSRVIVVAPHGGKIEPGTAELAQAIAGDEYDLYTFVGVLRSDNSRLHITSSAFDEPICVSALQRAEVAVGVHGCGGEVSRVCLGGLHVELIHACAASLRKIRLPVFETGHEFPGTNPENVCNRARGGRGLRLELSRDLRQLKHLHRIANAVREALAQFAAPTMSRA